MVVAESMGENYVAVGGSSPADELPSMQRCHSVESLAEWRSCDQVENGTPSTSPPYWDSDDEDDSGPKPSDLYGKFTWKIENFSQISKRELRSNAFEVGGYRWYILIYPQGCDACNHLSLFLCVANHDKLLPGWSHFALFTIAVVNKDPKKNKYNDTLHRFWKKEHDWGWKKFMELTKVHDGFVDDDTLTIKAQVQVIREKAHRPFRCLDCQYRRELIRVYLSAVEKTCAEFFKERRLKVQTLIGDKAKWSSFCAFWLGIDQNTRQHMSRDKTEAILKVVVKHFFIEKEVASTLIMDSLYSGLRALESQSKMKKLRASILEKEELPAPIIFIEDDMFVLADDVFLLLERAAWESPHHLLSSKEEKGVQTRTKDGCSGDEFNRDSILRDERRLTGLGRRTLEIFVLAHIFSSRIEISFQEAVALKRQEELIREEEEAEQAENERREKRARKKQARQKRNNRKGKDRRKDDKSLGVLNEKRQLQDSPCSQMASGGQLVNEQNVLAEVFSDASDPGDDGEGALQPDVEVEDRDTSPLSWDTDASELHPTAESCRSEISSGSGEKKGSSLVDDSSSTCSTDSVPSVVVNGPYKGNSSANKKDKRNLSSRGKTQQNKDMRNNSTPDADRLLYVSGSCTATVAQPEDNEKEVEDVKAGQKIVIDNQLDMDIPSKSSAKVLLSLSSYSSTSKKPVPVEQSTDKCTVTLLNEQVSVPESTSSSRNKPETPVSQEMKSSEVSVPESTSSSRNKSETPVSQEMKSSESLSTPRSESLKHTTQTMTSTAYQASSISRPSSAPIFPGPKPTVSLVSTSHTGPVLSRTLSSIGHSDSETSLFSRKFEAKSYRNATMGIKTATEASSSGFTPRSSWSSSTQYTAFSQSSSSSSSSSSACTHQATVRKDQTSVNHSSSFGPSSVDFLHAPRRWIDQSHSYANDRIRVGHNRDPIAPARQSQGIMPEEFPHLDIINDLLDEDPRVVGRATSYGYYQQDDLHTMHRQYTFPGDLVMPNMVPLDGSCQFDLPDQYYDELSQMVYDSFMPYHGFNDLQPLQVDLSVFDSGMDVLMQNQWPMNAPDLAMPDFGSAMDANGYAYQLPEYSACGMGGYNMMYQPANGI